MDRTAEPAAPDVGTVGSAEGKAWCLHCDGIVDYRIEKLEFLGNPVRASAYCIPCGERVQPEARTLEAAKRLRAANRRLRTGAGISLLLMLCLPILLAALLLWLLWRLL